VEHDALASRLAKQGFDLWQAGDLAAAVPKYLEALELASPDHYRLADYHGECGNVLSALDRDDEALVQFRRALGHELRDDPRARHAGVGVATYFLAEHLMKMHRCAEALETLTSSPALPGRTEWVLRYVESRALWRLHRTDEAKVSAARAIACAPSDEKATQLAADLAEIVGGDAG
jgi:hypothetical protein